MIGIKELLVTVANTPAETPVVVDVAGNGKALMPVTSAEVRDGKLVISCQAPAVKTLTSFEQADGRTKRGGKPAKPATAADGDNIELR